MARACVRRNLAALRFLFPDGARVGFRTLGRDKGWPISVEPGITVRAERRARPIFFA